MKLLTKFFRVAQEGDTIDGREITRQQIQQMAKNYDPKKYAGRVWLEHFRGLLPGGPFDALGDVVALQAKEEDGKMGLYAQLAPLPKLMEMNKAGQKLFTSIEIITNFAGTGEAYLVGLAVTDSPASLGTEMLSFNSGGANVFAGAAHEVTLEIMEDGQDDRREGSPTLFKRVKDLLGKNTRQTDQRFSDLEKAIEEIAQFAGNIKPGESVPPEFLTEFDTLQKSHNALAGEFKALAEKLNSTQAPGQQERAPATGGDGKAVTDC